VDFALHVPIVNDVSGIIKPRVVDDEYATRSANPTRVADLPTSFG